MLVISILGRVRCIGMQDLTFEINFNMLALVKIGVDGDSSHFISKIEPHLYGASRSVKTEKSSINN